jgi:purine-binding chemotaxis protein CheW
LDNALVIVSEKVDSIQLIGFQAGGRLFGVDILSIREILRAAPLEPIVNAPSFVAGGIRIRGTLIPAVDLKNRLGKPHPSDRPERSWVLIARLGDNDVGFLVDSVTRILKIAPDSVLPAPDIILTGLRSQYIQGVCNSESGMLVVLDLNRVLVADEVNALKKMVIHDPI